MSVPPGQHLPDAFFQRHARVYPADVEAFAFHFAEPGHLPFGELVDGGVQLGDHIFVGEPAGEVEGEVLYSSP